jgi:hypothetical protein
MDWHTIEPYAGLLLGYAIRTLVPWLFAALSAVREANDWGAWVRFEARYLASLGLAVLGATVALAFSPALREYVGAMTWLEAIPWAAFEQETVRWLEKLFNAVSRRVAW